MIELYHNNLSVCAQKVRIALRLRRETTMTLEWIADRLCMGAATHVASLLQRHNQKGPSSEETLF